MKLLALGIRGEALTQLGSLLVRGVPLDAALAALHDELPARARPAIAAATQQAREGGALGSVLETAKLLGARDRAVVEAASGATAGRAVALVGEELSTRERLARSLRLVFVRPAWKVAALGLFAVVFALVGVAPAGVVPFLPFRNYLYEGYEIEPHVGANLTLTQPLIHSLLDAASLLASLGVLVLGLRSVARSAPGRHFLERLARGLPVASTFVPLETGATFLRAFGTGLASGLSLPAALTRGRDALEGRLAARDVEGAIQLANDGAPIHVCLARVPFLDATTSWLVGVAADRPDLAREILELARSCEDRLQEEIARWAPLLGNLPELAAASALVVMLLRMGLYVHWWSSLWGLP